MHVIALIDQKSRQNGIDYGMGRFRCEEGQFGTFLFKVLPSARVTKYCHPFSEGDVVTLVGQFSYETVDKVEGFTGFTLNVSVAAPFPIPSSGCWEPEEIPLSSPYLSFNTQPVPGSLRQIENCQFIRTKSSINSGYTKRYTDSRFRIGYQIDNDKWDNIASNWDTYPQFFISGFFLCVDNGEVHIEATEIELDPLSKKYGKNSNLSSSTNSNVPGVSPLAKNLAKLLEQEKSSFSTSPSGIFGKNFLEQTSTKLSTEKKSLSLRPLAPKNSSSSLQQSQNQTGTQSDSTNTESIKDLLKGLQHHLQRINQIPGQTNSHISLFQHTPLSEQQPSAEQIAELIADQGTRQDLSPLVAGNQSKLPSYSVWPLQGQETAIYHRDKISMTSQVINQNEREKSLTQQNERDKQTSQQITTHQQELVKSPTQYMSPQNERESTPSQIDISNKNDSVRTSRAESESGESMDLEQSKKSGKKSSSDDKTKTVRPTSRATLGNRFIVYEPKFAQETEGNKQDGTSTGKRGRKSKNTNTSRPSKKTKSKKSVNETDTTTANQEEQVIDSTNESPKNTTDKDSAEKSKNVSVKLEETTSKDNEGNNNNIDTEIEN
ncbi:hypothetical protein RclHR1_02060008 [Rhizophagus clarus]|uniref:Uncharacterized protein n=1 Tax=Rhizophagus clarus TaxID=94130 RepID=A0A2Z6QTJ9_9GLOM|nr:hypothetical protein RclHR1_02060008 [Rhizophagus clarus]